MSTADGQFIVFEGIDRSGKTTQTARLAKTLREKYNKTVVEVRFPNYTTAIGKIIGQYLRSEITLEAHAVHLLFSANRWELIHEIAEHMRNGAIVVCDRFLWSGVAYSVAKGLPFRWCMAPDSDLQPTPKFVIYFDVPVAVAAQRGNFGVDDCHEKTDFLAQVRCVYEDHFAERIDWMCIDASKTPDEVAAAVEWVVATQLELTNK